jgi:hypothetical protein
MFRLLVEKPALRTFSTYPHCIRCQLLCQTPIWQRKMTTPSEKMLLVMSAIL